MDAVKYLKTKARMTEKCLKNCNECKLNITNNGKKVSCLTFEYNYPEETVKIAEEWDKEHPVKTRAQVFFERFPDAPRHEDGRPKPCVLDCGLVDECPNEYCGGKLQYCVYCWDEPVLDK